MTVLYLLEYASPMHYISSISVNSVHLSREGASELFEGR